MEKQIWLYTGEVKYVTLKQFLSKVEVKEVSDKINEWWHNQEIAHHTYMYGSLDNDPIYSKSTYARTVVSLEGKSYLKDLYSQCTFKLLEGKQLQNLAEDAMVDHMIHFGRPSYLVRVSPRKWMVAQPEDFRIIKNKYGEALICSNKSRTVVNDISKFKQSI